MISDVTPKVTACGTYIPFRIFTIKIVNMIYYSCRFFCNPSWHDNCWNEIIQ